MKTTVTIPDELFRQADQLAARLGISRSKLYAQALTRLIENDRSADVTARLDQLYGDNGQDSALPSDAARLQARAVTEEVPVSQDIVTSTILAYVNGHIALSDLVAWAEGALMQVLESDADAADEALLIRILGTIAAGDCAEFILTPDVLLTFLKDLETAAQSVNQAN